MTTRRKAKPLPSVDTLNDLFLYNKNTGHLIWRSRKTAKNFQDLVRWNNRYAGRIAGSARRKTNGSPFGIVVDIHSIGFLVHRIAWKMVTGEEPPDEIDHVDGDPFNNAWSNLRDGNACNMLNKRRYRANTSGVAGVTWAKNCGKWRAQVQAGGKVKYLGLFGEDDLDLAAMAVMEARAEMGFSPRHGM